MPINIDTAPVSAPTTNNAATKLHKLPWDILEKIVTSVNVESQYALYLTCESMAKAVTHASPKILEIQSLFQSLADKPNDRLKALLDIIEKNDIKLLTDFIEKFPEAVNQVYRRGEFTDTPLCVAAVNKNREAVELLLQAGAYVNQPLGYRTIVINPDFPLAPAHASIIGRARLENDNADVVNLLLNSRNIEKNRGDNFGDRGMLIMDHHPALRYTGPEALRPEPEPEPEPELRVSQEELIDSPRPRRSLLSCLMPYCFP